MKLTLPFLLIFLSGFFLSFESHADRPQWDDPHSLPKWLTPEEKLRLHEVGKNFTPTDPPTAPVRSIAEFERLEGVLIRYPLGIPLDLVAAMSQHAMVYTIVADQSTENQAITDYTNAGVNMDNTGFITAPTNSYWTRDYGPWYIADGNQEVAVVDFPYNRPRPGDDAIPGVVATHFGLTRYGMDLVHTGGNYMSDGMGQAASTDLVFTENNHNQTYVLDKMEDFLGIENYHVTIDAQGDYIQHIDTWAKFLDVDKILIGEVPENHPRYWAYEQVADYFAGEISSYGTPYQVYRVYTPDGQPYTNALILNDKVYVPITGSSWDTNALEVYEEAMPGYEVLGFHGNWHSTDALHCRVKDMADTGMLHISHIPLHGEHDYQPEFEIQADIIPYSGEDLYTDSLFLIYTSQQPDGIFEPEMFDTVPMFHVEGHTYAGLLPVAPDDTLVSYYLSAADASGRKETWPLIGAPGARSFSLISPAEFTYEPESLEFESYPEMLEGKALLLSNQGGTVIDIDNIYMQGTQDIPWYIEPSSVSFPYALEPDETLELTVYVDPFGFSKNGEFLSDSILIIADGSEHFVKVHLHEAVSSAPDIAISPDSLVFETYDQMVEGLPLVVSNPEEINLDIEFISMEGTYGLPWYVEPGLNFPYTLEPDENLELTVFVEPYGLKNSEDYMTDSLFIHAGPYEHLVMIYVRDDIFVGSGIAHDAKLPVKAYPNPFSERVQLEFTLEGTEHVVLDIFDLQGRKVRTLINESMNAGSHTLEWDGRSQDGSRLPDGIYLARLLAGKQMVSLRIFMMQ